MVLSIVIPRHPRSECRGSVASLSAMTAMEREVEVWLWSLPLRLFLMLVVPL